MLGQQAHLLDAAVLLLFKLKNLGFAGHPGFIFKNSFQLHVGVGHRQYPAGNSQNLAHAGHCMVEGIGNPVERCQQQIAKGLPGQAAFGKAVAQKLLHDRLHIGQGLHTVADIARRGHAQFLTQHAGAAAVVCHGNDGSQVVRLGLQTAQHGGKSGTAADGDNFGSSSYKFHI